MVTIKGLIHEAIMYPRSVCLVGSSMTNVVRIHHAELTLDYQRSMKDETEQRRSTDEATIGTLMPKLSLVYSNTHITDGSIVPYCIPCVIVELAVRKSIRIKEHGWCRMGGHCEGGWSERRKHAH
jgi:hypothetical protein